MTLARRLRFRLVVMSVAFVPSVANTLVKKFLVERLDVGVSYTLRDQESVTDQGKPRVCDFTVLARLGRADLDQRGRSRDMTMFVCEQLGYMRDHAVTNRDAALGMKE